LFGQCFNGFFPFHSIFPRSEFFRIEQGIGLAIDGVSRALLIELFFEGGVGGKFCLEIESKETLFVVVFEWVNLLVDFISFHLYFACLFIDCLLILSILGLIN
jgi:hypothetical protein